MLASFGAMQTFATAEAGVKWRRAPIHRARRPVAWVARPRYPGPLFCPGATETTLWQTSRDLGAATAGGDNQNAVRVIGFKGNCGGVAITISYEVDTSCDHGPAQPQAKDLRLRGTGS